MNEQEPGYERAEQKVTETTLYPVLNDQLQQRYDKVAPEWNGTSYEGLRRDDLIATILEKAELQHGQNVLEVMSGTALLSQEVKKSFPSSDVYALDFSRGMLNMIPNKIHRVQASAIAMPFIDKSFDRVFLRSAIYDVPRQMQIKIMREVSRVLKDDGTWLLQTYYTTPETHEALNSIVNIKDLASGQYLDMGQELPRYFALIVELEEWFNEVGFDAEKVQDFEGIMRYMRTHEMTSLGAKMWLDYVQALPNEVKESLKLRFEEDNTLTYNFPGTLYKLKQR